MTYCKHAFSRPEGGAGGAMGSTIPGDPIASPR